MYIILYDKHPHKYTSCINTHTYIYIIEYLKVSTRMVSYYLYQIFNMYVYVYNV